MSCVLFMYSVRVFFVTRVLYSFCEEGKDTLYMQMDALASQGIIEPAMSDGAA